MTTIVQIKLVTNLNVVDKNYECFNLFIIHIITYYNITHSIMKLISLINVYYIYIYSYINIYRNNKIISISEKYGIFFLIKCCI